MSWLPYLLFVPLAWALFRKKCRYFDGVTVAVALGMAAAMALWDMPRVDLPVALALIDGTLAMALVAVVFVEKNCGIPGWTDKAHRAQFVGIAGIAKVCVWLSLHNGGLPNYAVAAWMVNLLLLYQILVAGGVGHERLAGLGRAAAGFIRHRIFGRANSGVA